MTTNDILPSDIQLIGIFVQPHDLHSKINDIIDTYKNILNNRIYVLSIVETNELFCSFNILRDEYNKLCLPDSFVVHRKKETNTIYTINAINIISNTTNNALIDWNDYKNCIIITSNKEVHALHTNIYRIVRLR